MTDLQFEKLKGIIRDWVICKKSIFKRFKLGMEFVDYILISSDSFYMSVANYDGFVKIRMIDVGNSDMVVNMSTKREYEALEIHDICEWVGDSK